MFTTTGFEVTEKLNQWLVQNEEYLLNYWHSKPYEDEDNSDYWITKCLKPI